MEEVRSLSVGPTSDLVVAAPWRPGLIAADEPILPQSRLALTFRTIFELRRQSREALPTIAFADPIERLERIHSFRLAAEPNEMRLAVTFDFGWESYMRALWADAGPFLDLLCCHCADYRLARDTPLAEWRGWIRRRQRRSDYFYSATALTVGDLAALSQSERLQRDQGDGRIADRLLAGFASRSAVDIAHENRLRFPEEAVRQAIGVVAAMYRLTRYWTADVAHSALGEDAMTLICATRGLIEDRFVEPGSFPAKIEMRFRSELSWYRQNIGEARPRPDQAPLDRADVQRGVLTSFEPDGAAKMCGAAVFLAVTDAAPARRALAALELASETSTPRDGVFRNLAFTFGGLRRLRLPAALLEAAPTAFREGAAARAGLVGDVRSFHPLNWQPLRRNWGRRPDDAVALDQVDLLVQLRTAAPGGDADIGDRAHPLHKEIGRLARLPGLELLAVEALTAADPARDINHLGFRDGLSQPTLDGPRTRPWSDVVEPGALLFGRDEATTDPFWRDGSFLAVRRMPVDRVRFDALIGGDCLPALRDPSLLAAKIVGRMADGRPLAPAYGPNNFTYDDDESGAVCPLSSHARRANPRRGEVPRIMRRGMSFGPPAGAPSDRERGSFFMAYCADLAEQYERVLGWVNGGNSTRVGSYLGDPFVGPPDGAGGRTYRFLHSGTAHRVTLPDALRGAVSLSWSLYLFAPSLSAVRELGTPDVPAGPDPAIQRGRDIIAALTATKAPEEAWHAVLTDSGARERGETAAVWAAVRADGGATDTPAGYLVGSHALVMDILRDDGRNFTNTGAGERMAETVGRFHLGMDPCTPDYAAKSEPANSALGSIDAKTAFGSARRETGVIVGRLLAELRGARSVTIDLLRDLIEPLLGTLAQAWFDIPDGKHLVIGGQDWSAPETRAPRFPGDFWTPSRFTFNPFRSPETERLANAHGKAVVAAAIEHLRGVGRATLTGPVSRLIAAGTRAYPDDDALARVLVGCMVGAVPTVAGNAASLLDRGFASGELDRAQRQWLAKPPGARTWRAALDCFGPRLDEQLTHAPVPEVLWRKAATDGVPLGKFELEKGACVIFSLESASLDQLSSGVENRWLAYGRAPPDEAATAHGCPAFAMADGIMLGLAAGLAETARFTRVTRGTAALRPL